MLVPGRGVGAATYNSDTIRPGNMAQVLSRKDSTMNISDSICPDCGGLLEVRRQGASQGMFCTLCSWALLTTCLPDFLNDATSYRVTVISGDVDNNAHVQAVASLTGLALPQARALLRAPAGLEFTGLAYEVAPMQETLAGAGLEFRIEPPFPW